MQPLWPPQVRAIGLTHQARSEGHRKILVTLPTGGGKTRVLSELIRDCLIADMKVGVYTNRNMLIEQLCKSMNAFGLPHGDRSASTLGPKDMPSSEPFQIMSVQTEHSRVMVKKTWQLHQADIIYIDEAHLNRSDMMLGLLGKHLEQGATYVGLTATPFDLGHMYEHLIVAGTNSELRDCGALVHAVHYGPDEPDCSKIKKNTWEYTENDVRKVMKVQNIIGRMSEWFKKLNPEQKPTLLFAPGVPESLWCAQKFSSMGIPSAHIDGESCWLDGKEYASDQSIRDDIRAMLKDGMLKIVCNRFVLREGIDMPFVEHLILATVFGSVQSYIQSVGRGLRASPSTGKTKCTIQDHGGSWHRHGSANMDRQWFLDLTESMSQNARNAELREKKQPEPMRCPQCAKILLSNKCSCGFVITHKTRPVIGDDGELRQHLGDIFPQRKIKEPPGIVEIWTNYYYRAKNSRNGMTFNQADGLFYQELFYYPPRNLPLMPISPLDWSRRVKDVPRERLIQPKKKEPVNADS